jgi:hypothetical protein
MKKGEVVWLGVALAAPHLAANWLFALPGQAPGHEDLVRQALVLGTLLPFYPGLRRRWTPGIAAAALLLVVYGTQALEIPAGNAGWLRLVACVLGSWVALLWWHKAASDGPLHATVAALIGMVAGGLGALNPVGFALVGLPLASLLSTTKSRGAHARALAWAIAGAIGGAAAVATVRGSALSLAAPALTQSLYDLWGPRYGLLYWSPLLWLGLLAPLACFRRERRWTMAHTLTWLIALALACFRQGLGRADAIDIGFEPLLGTLILGLAGGVASVIASLRRRRLGLAIAAVAVVVGWNLCFMEQYTRYLIPRDDTVAFDRVVANSAGLVARCVGAPNAWPAVWWFGLSEHVALDRYDPLFAQPVWRGTSAFFEIGDPGADAPWLLEGWDSGRRRGDAWCRPIKGTAGLLVPVPSSVSRDAAVKLSVRSQGHGTLVVIVSGVRVAERPLTEGFSDDAIVLGARYWKSPVTHLAFKVPPPGAAAIDWFSLE